MYTVYTYKNSPFSDDQVTSGTGFPTPAQKNVAVCPTLAFPNMDITLCYTLYNVQCTSYILLIQQTSLIIPPPNCNRVEDL